MTLKKDDHKIVIKIGSKYATLDAQLLPLNSPAIIENSRVYLPLADIGQMLGYKVSWKNNCVYLNI